MWLRPNPIDEQRFFYKKQHKDRFRTELTKFSSDQKVLLYLAKFGELKNQSFLLEVISQLPKEHCLILAGPLGIKGGKGIHDLEYVTSLEETITVRDLSDRVILIKHFIESPEDFMTLAKAGCPMCYVAFKDLVKMHLATEYDSHRGKELGEKSEQSVLRLQQQLQSLAQTRHRR